MNSDYKIITASIRQKDGQLFENCDDMPVTAQEIIDRLIEKREAFEAPAYSDQQDGYTYCLVPVSIEHEFFGFLYGCLLYTSHHSIQMAL